MRNPLHFVPLLPSHALTIKRQKSQRTVFGLDAAMSPEEAEHLAAQPVAWTAFDGDRIAACFGLNETFPGQVGVGWAMLSDEIGVHHLQLTRFIQKLIAESGLPRIELFAPCADVELLINNYPGFDPWALVCAAMAKPTAECRWAVMLGLRPVHVVRRFGLSDESFMYFERVL